MQNFLTNERYSVLIAKVAVVFQTLMTLGIVLGLILMSYTSFEGLSLVTLCLYLDALFVVIHLSYRKLYSGRKIILKKNEVLILVLHSTLSILALLFTFLFIREPAHTYNPLVVWTILSTWIASLAFGIIFYIKKYKRQRES